MKGAAGLNVVSKTFGAEFDKVAAVYAHPLTPPAGRLNVLRRDKSEIGNHEVFSLKNLKRCSSFFTRAAVPKQPAFDSGKVFGKNGDRLGRFNIFAYLQHKASPTNGHKPVLHSRDSPYWDHCRQFLHGPLG
jgi:hypothetical protein